MARSPKAPDPQFDPSWLLEEPTSEVEPPVQSRSGSFPFLEVGWQDFERLCRRLAEAEGRIQHAWSYGEHGQAQFGIDLLVRKTNGNFEVWQTKRYKKVDATNVTAAIELFLRHKWADDATRFVLCFACSVIKTGVVEALEKARDRLAERGIAFDVMGEVELTARLRAEPEIVDDFFGRAWVEKLCPPEAQERLVNRLSRFEGQVLRSRLRAVHASWIATSDPGLPIAALGRLGSAIPAPLLKERFVEPDLLVEHKRAGEMAASSRDRSRETIPADPKEKSDAVSLRASPSHRVGLRQLLSTSRQLIVTADVGAGKTTLLRAIATDLLQANPTVTKGAADIAGKIPVWVPFPLWTGMASKAGSPPALETVVKRFYEALADSSLASSLAKAIAGGHVVLLVDGLDEAEDLVAAATVARLLFTYAGANRIPVILTSRPHGLRSLGAPPADWLEARLAPLDETQRSLLSSMWFTQLEIYEQDSGADPSTFERRVQQRTRAFIDELATSPGVEALHSTPLFLLALLSLHRQKRLLPRSKSETLQEVIAQLVEHQPRRRQADALATSASPLSTRTRDRVLDDFAFAIQAGELASTVPDAVHFEDAERRGVAKLQERLPDMALATAEEEAMRIFGFAEERVGLLTRKGTNLIGFFHRSFQEYLSARHMHNWSMGDKLNFVRENARLPSWRESILHLLHLTRGETDVGQLVSAIANAEAEDLMQRQARDGLVAKAVFADLAHDVASVRELALAIFDQIEQSPDSSGEAEAIYAIVDGLSSETVGGLAARKLEEWIPNRHGWARRGVLSTIPQWPTSLQEAAVPVLIRLLQADEISTQLAAAETLSVLRAKDEQILTTILARLATATTPGSVASLLHALALGWWGDTRVIAVAETARLSLDAKIATEALRVRARNGLTDNEDAARFYKGMRKRRSLFGSADSELLEHFAQTRGTQLVQLIEADLVQVENFNPHDLAPLVSGLLHCNASHPKIEPALLSLLKHDWMLRELTTGHQGFPVQLIRWTPKLRDEIEARVRAERHGHHGMEYYWLSRVLKSDQIKRWCIQRLKAPDNFSFWQARSLAEVWGVDDPEVRYALLPFLDEKISYASVVAEVFPELIQDPARCRRVLLDALSGPLNRVDFLFRALRRVGVGSDDEEAFNVCSTVRTSGRIAEEWREQMLLTFPRRAEMRQMAMQELDRKDGMVAAVAASYPEDREILAQLLRTISPLPTNGRLAIVEHLRRVAPSSAVARRLLRHATQDTEGVVASDASIATTEVLILLDQDRDEAIQDSVLELDAVGMDYEERRVTGAINLALLDRFDEVSKRRQETDKFSLPTLRAQTLGDDRYLRRVLAQWPQWCTEFSDARGVVEAFDMHAEIVLPLLDPLVPHARQLYDFFMQDDQTMKVLPVVRLAVIARFEPGSERLKALVTSILTRPSETHFAAGSAAAEVFASQFTQDEQLLLEIRAAFRADPGGPAAGALAALCLQSEFPDVVTELDERAQGLLFDLPSNLQLCALLSSAEALVEAFEHWFKKADVEQYRYLAFDWPSGLISRLRRDEDARALLMKSCDDPTDATYVLAVNRVLHLAMYVDSKHSAELQDLLASEEARAVPLVAVDIASGEAVLLKTAIAGMLL